MKIQDLQRMLAGAMAAGVETFSEFMKVCKANNLHTNAQKLAYFTKYLQVEQIAERQTGEHTKANGGEWLAPATPSKTKQRTQTKPQTN